MKSSVWMLCVLAGISSAVLAADPPAFVNYQGVLRDSADKPVPSGPYSMVFRFYDSPGPGGNAILVDTQTVTVTGGLFNVQLGAGAADGPGPGVYTSLTQVFADYANLYLEVQVGSETLAPRTSLAAAGYALNARRLRGVELVSPGPLSLYVSAATGNDANDGLSPARAKRAIQSAVNAIPPVLGGDATVYIADGTYRERILIVRHTRAGVLGWIRLVGNTASPQNVAIDGGGIAPPEDLDSAIVVLDLPVEISGITVQNFGPSGDNFGLQAGFSAYVELRNCRFVNNSLGEGAVAAEDGSLIQANDCLISGNTTGVMARYHGTFRAENNVEVSGNTVAGAAASFGGGVHFDPRLPLECTISNNPLRPEDHSTIMGYSRCLIANSPCEPAADDSTARCVP